MANVETTLTHGAKKSALRSAIGRPNVIEANGSRPVRSVEAHSLSVDQYFPLKSLPLILLEAINARFSVSVFMQGIELAPQ